MIYIFLNMQDHLITLASLYIRHSPPTPAWLVCLIAWNKTVPPPLPPTCEYSDLVVVSMAFVNPTSIKSFPFHRQQHYQQYVDFLICISPPTHLSSLFMQSNSKSDQSCGKPSKINISVATIPIQKASDSNDIVGEKAGEKIACESTTK